MVLCILVEITLPVKIRPRMETMPVNGHFLSTTAYQHSALSSLFRLEPPVQAQLL